MAAAALRRRIVQLPVAGAAAMSAHLRASVDQRPMTRFQWSVIALCMVLNMIDGFDVLVMAFTASAVSAHWQLSGAQLGFLLSAGLFGDRKSRRPNSSHP